jgi:hypothetical protein
MSTPISNGNADPDNPFPTHYVRLFIRQLNDEPDMHRNVRVVVFMKDDEEAQRLIAGLDSVGIPSFQATMNGERHHDYSCLTHSRLIAAVVHCNERAIQRIGIPIRTVSIIISLATILLCIMFYAVYFILKAMHRAMENCLQADI